MTQESTCVTTTNLTPTQIRDLELIAQRCLRLRIFGDAMKLQKDPHAAVIAAAQAKGLYPKTIDLHQILQES